VVRFGTFEVKNGLKIMKRQSYRCKAVKRHLLNQLLRLFTEQENQIVGVLQRNICNTIWRGLIS
jgi:hypothetical protein